jgi:hypothetical protein
MVKIEPIEIDKNHMIVSNGTVTTFMSHSSPTKRSRKAAHPSKTIKTSIETSLMNQVLKSTHHIDIDESTTTVTSTDDELSNLPQFEQDEDDIGTDEGTLSIHNHISSRRPRLSYNKRLEANARERERVHNLTAAFEALRQVIPMYGDQPKLSRLSILRIACSYVLVLGALNEIDFSEGQNAYTFNESFHMLSSTILTELKRKKTNNNRND